MNSRQAKDFLVEQAAQQAAIEGVALSELEKRMMYFTEGPDAVEDPIQLNEDFEATYDTAEYEEKISQLLKHARKRIKSESPAKLETWKQAITALGKGDHYLSILVPDLGARLPSPSGWPWAVIFTVSIRVLVPIATAVGIMLLLRGRISPVPHVSAYVFFALFVAIYLVGVSWSWRGPRKVFDRIGKAVGRYLFGRW